MDNSEFIPDSERCFDHGKIEIYPKFIQRAIIGWLTADYLDRGGVIHFVRFGVITVVREPCMTAGSRERLEPMLRGCAA